MRPDEPPDPLRELDGALRGFRAEPRASLGPEIAGRYLAGERAPRRPFAWTRGWRVWASSGVAALMVGAFAVRGGLVPPLDAFAQTTTIDHCCQDMDFGPEADDGILIETVAGSRVRRLVVYEDSDHSGGWSTGDAVRFVRHGPPDVRTVPLNELATRHLCCLDYDGGGADDDGVLLLGSPTDGVVMAAIYESASPTSAPLR